MWYLSSTSMHQSHHTSNSTGYNYNSMCPCKLCFVVAELLLFVAHNINNRNNHNNKKLIICYVTYIAPKCLETKLRTIQYIITIINYD